MCRWCCAPQTLWDELEQLSGERIMHRSGVINLAPADSTFLNNVIESANAHQLNVQVLQTEEIRQRWPQLNVPDGYLGAFEADSGYLLAEQAIRSYIRLAEQAGCAQLFNCGVDSIGTEGDLQTVTTGDGRFSRP